MNTPFLFESQPRYAGPVALLDIVTVAPESVCTSGRGWDDRVKGRSGKTDFRDEGVKVWELERRNIRCSIQE